MSGHETGDQDRQGGEGEQDQRFCQAAEQQDLRVAETRTAPDGELSSSMQLNRE
jgi:hypothetical protein